MIEIGRLCVKIAGRDSGQYCVVVDILDNMFVLIDGQTRRRKCNVMHLEPLAEVLGIKKGASTSDVQAALKERGIEATSTKPKTVQPRPTQKRKTPTELRAAKDAKKADAQSSPAASAPSASDAKPKKKSAAKK